MAGKRVRGGEPKRREPSTPAEEDVDEADPEAGVELSFPLSRVQRIMKTEKLDVSLVSREASVLMNKAAECFLELLADETAAVTTADRRKQVQYKDILQAVRAYAPPKVLQFLADELKFVEEAVPTRKGPAAGGAKANSTEDA